MLNRERLFLILLFIISINVVVSAAGIDKASDGTIIRGDLNVLNDTKIYDNNLIFEKGGIDINLSPSSGVLTLDQNLEIQGALKIGASGFGIGKVLVTDASGNASWGEPPAGPEGEVGDQGPQGADGAQGAQGPDGELDNNDCVIETNNFSGSDPGTGSPVTSVTCSNGIRVGGGVDCGTNEMVAQSNPTLTNGWEGRCVQNSTGTVSIDVFVVCCI